LAPQAGAIHLALGVSHAAFSLNRGGPPLQPDQEVVQDASVANMLDVLAWEIELAGARCLKLDALVGQLMETLPTEQIAPLVEGMHTIDLLSQHLTGLSAFSRKMSEKIDEDMRAPYGAALDELTLGALADRLCVALGGEEKGINDGEDAGDLDLF
jgi:hypothetical protein